MKIVKEFEDPEFFIRTYGPYTEHSLWKWGLGDDGELYCKSSDFQNPNDWIQFDYTISYCFGISDMKKIVKEFGHLLVWL